MALRLMSQFVFQIFRMLHFILNSEIIVKNWKESFDKHNQHIEKALHFKITQESFRLNRGKTKNSVKFLNLCNSYEKKTV